MTAQEGQAASLGAQAARLRVFISYSRDDLDFADQLVAALELTGFQVALDRHKITGGEDFQRRLETLIRDSDTIVFVLSPHSAKSTMCAWEVDQATRLSKRIIPIVCTALGNVRPPERLAALDYVFFYPEAKVAGSGFGQGLVRLVTALNTDLDWMQEHTRLLVRASEWDSAARPENRLLSGADIPAAKAWAARRPKGAPEPTGLHLDFIRASEDAEQARTSAERRRLDDLARFQAEREQALSKAETAQAERADATRRLARRTMIGLAAALVLTLTSTVASYLAWQKATLASEETRRAENNLSAISDAISILDNISDAKQVAQRFFSIAQIFDEQGRREDAIRILKRSAAISEKEFGKDSAELAAARRQIGGIYAKLNKLPEAEQYLSEALASYEASANVAETPPILDQLALIYTAKGDVAKASEALEKSRRIAIANAATIMQIFFGTDRAVAERGQTPGFGSARGQALTLGTASVTVPSSHGVSAIEQPFRISVGDINIYQEPLNTTRHFTLQRLQLMPAAEFAGTSREALSGGAKIKDHALVFVHGYNTTFQTALFQAASVAYDIKFDGGVYVYSWPSGGEVTSFTYDRDSAARSEPFLKEFLSQVAAQSGATKISVITQGMGAGPVLDAIRDLNHESKGAFKLENLILSLPDLDRDRFSAVIGEAGPAVQNITLYASSADRALALSRRMAGGTATAGDVTAQGPLVLPGVDTIDVSDAGSQIGALRPNALLVDLAELLRTGERPPAKRNPGLEAVAGPDGVYWRAKP